MDTPSRDADRLIDHEYDGIREYDNPLPRWWVWTFYATIVFAVLYWFNLGIGVGPGRLAQYQADVLSHQRPEPAAGAGLADLGALVGDQAAIARGREVFVTTCASCHRADGGGGIGPNLTDAAWIHGEGLAEIHRTIVEGVPAKGMPSWGKLLPREKVDAVTVYVLSLAGTNPPDPKAPEGQPVKQ
jgi:cytochrome c oxidase cbb3-type subunit 3